MLFLYQRLLVFMLICHVTEGLIFFGCDVMAWVDAEQLITAVGDDIAEKGYSVITEAFPHALAEALLAQLLALEPDAFRLAGIGRENDFQTNKEIRSDRILWLDEELLETQQYFTWIEQMRLALNQRFFLGLFEYECMFAHYPKGAFYQKHVDSFRIDGIRKVSTVLYLNPDWQFDDGGELLIYHDEAKLPFLKVLPTFNKLVVFLSEEFPHEVLPAQKSRFSLTGWYRINA